ncbi:MAG TPA: ATP-binding cassette domain-containing protein [Actinomycetes bacterium]|jgi:daunorubicin resistance ABC transporter ATP-binding subunit|nr:ATP-binding cassette domain-containing protein [Actinomycetes bacterium]
MSQPAIAVDKLHKRYGTVVALDGLSFDVAPGKVMGLLGPNGSGKTTTIAILSTALRPGHGRAAVCGLDVVTDAAAVRQCIGFAGQYAAVDANLTGRENLALIGRLSRLPRRLARDRAEELLARFDLTAAADRLVRTYSGGMRRRLDVAAALTRRPPVLFLDEPTTGLDPESRSQLWTMIRELVGDGATVLLTTQYLEEADALAEEVVILDRGRAVQVGTPAELKARVGSVVIELTFADEPNAANAEWVLAAHQYEPDRDRSVVRLPSPDGSRAVVGMIRALEGQAADPTTVDIHQPTLDEVFLALTGDSPAQAHDQTRGAA